MPKLTPNRLATLICVYFYIVGISYGLKTPLFEGPDELAHFVYMNRIVTLRDLNTIPGRSAMLEQRNFESHQHPLYYLVSAPLLTFFERDDFENYIELNPFASTGIVTGENFNVQLHPLEHVGDTVWAVWTIRLFSLLMGVGALLCVYHVGRLIWDVKLGLAAMLLTASIPQFAHVASSINNDNLNILFSAIAVTILVQMWHDREIGRLPAVLLGLTLVGILLAKLTGIIAYGYAVGALLLGGMLGRFKWRRVGFALAAMSVTFLMFGLWWFVRNQVLYDDAIGLSPTLSLWSRNRDRLPSFHEVRGIWISFWMMLGHLNIPGPPWLIPYAYIVTAVALVGAGVRSFRNRETMWYVLFFLTVQVMAWIVVIYITRQVNVSQGRALFMTLAAFSPLIVLGWRELLGERLYTLPIAPLAVMTLIAPYSGLGQSYELLERVETARVDVPFATPMPINEIDAIAESIDVLGYHLLTQRVSPGEDVVLDVWFSGGHDENPVLFVTAQHPVTGERLGSIDTYPGMTATRILQDDEIYRARVRLRLDSAPTDEPPFRVQLALGFRVPDEEDLGSGRFVNWTDAQGAALPGVFINGPVFTAPGYTAPQMANNADIPFGGQIALRGHTLQQEADSNTVRVELLWERLEPISENYTLTVGLLDENNELVAQQDAPPPAYPTSVWVDGNPFVTVHTLQTDADIAELRLRVGWYHSQTFERLPVGTGVNVVDQMWALPLAQLELD